MAAGTIGIGGIMLIILGIMVWQGGWSKLQVLAGLATGVLVAGGIVGTIVHAGADNVGPTVTDQINRGAGDSNGDNGTQQNQQPTNTNPGNGRQ